MFLDCIASDIDNSSLKTLASDFDPDIVFMETSAPSFLADVETMRALGRPTLAGGAHATTTCKEHLERGFAGVIRGEYDQVITQAIDLSAHPWLATPDHPDAVHAPMIKELDELPYPAWDLMPMGKYNDPFCSGRSVTVLSSRGCPLICSFCTIAPHQGKNGYRRRDPKAICDEIQTLIDLYHPHEIYFDDDTITIHPRHILALCEEIKSRNWGLPWSCMGNATVDRNILEAMAHSGCRALKFGVETGDPEVMKRIPKYMDLEDVRRTVADCRELGIRCHANFLFGLPGENRESAMRTIDFAIGLNTHTLQFAIATPYPGTRFYDEAKEKRWLSKDNWIDYDPAGEAVVSYPDYSAEEIVAMHDLAWRRWQWTMLTRRPSTVMHHFESAFRREGLHGVLRLGRYSAERFFTVLGAH